jgi:hypothetical protein
MPIQYWIFAGTVTARCRGCTSWINADGNRTTISPNGTSRFAWAMSSTAPKTPRSNTSTFKEHDHVNNYEHNMEYARSPLFDTWVASNLLPTTSSTDSPALQLVAVQHQLALSQDQQQPPLTPSPPNYLFVRRRSMPTACTESPQHKTLLKWPVDELPSRPWAVCSQLSSRVNLGHGWRLSCLWERQRHHGSYLRCFVRNCVQQNAYLTKQPQPRDLFDRDYFVRQLDVNRMEMDLRPPSDTCGSDQDSRRYWHVQWWSSYTKSHYITESSKSVDCVSWLKRQL